MPEVKLPKNGDHAEVAGECLIVWDPEIVSPEDYAELVTALGDLVRASGGVGVERINGEVADLAFDREGS